MVKQICLIALFLITFLSVRSSHIAGAELSYNYLGSDQYELVLKLYRDCHGIGFDNFIYLHIYNASSDTLDTLISIPTPAATPELPPMNWASCAGIPYDLCIEEGIYVDTITLPFISGGFDVGWSRCCRNYAITNMPSLQGVTWIAHIPGSDEADTPNSMPEFVNQPPLFLCANELFIMDHSAFDPDGDSLVYMISNPFTGINFQGAGTISSNPVVGPGNLLGPPPYQNVNYFPGYNYDTPFGSGMIQIDSITGLLQAMPMDTGVYVVAISVLEYRDGVLISENKRDFQFNVIQCLPQDNSPTLYHYFPWLTCLEDTLFANAGNNFCFDFYSVDDTSVQQLYVDAVSPILGGNGIVTPPLGTVTQSGSNPVTGTICWNPSVSEVGNTYPIVLSAHDSSACMNYNVALDTVWITVVSGQSPPVGIPDTFSISDHTLLFDLELATNDTDPENNLNPASVSPVGNSTAGGLLTPNGINGLIYSPPANFIGEDTVWYSICDAEVCYLCDTSYALIQILVLPDPPIAQADFDTLNEDDPPVLIFISTNDTDPENNLDLSSITILSPATSGAILNNQQDGTVIYNPVSNYTGMDTFTYQICDSTLLCDDDTVFIVVLPIPDPPLAFPDYDTILEDSDTLFISVVSNDTDPDDDLDAESLTLLEPPTSGGFVISGENGVILYSSPENFYGNDTVVYQICDSTGLCDTDTLFIFVLAQPDPPIAATDYIYLTEDEENILISALSNDTDPENNINPSLVVILSQPTSGGSAQNEPTGTVSYIPPPDFYGVDTVLYQICDSTFLCDNDTIFIFISPVPDPPVASTDSTQLAEDTDSAWVNILINDMDPDGDLDSSTLEIIEPPSSGGNIEIGPNGTVLYSPPLHFTGEDTVVYQICDSTGLCDIDTLFITVLNVPDPPLAETDYEYLAEDPGMVTIHAYVNDTDPDNDLDTSFIYIVSSPSSGGQALSGENGTLLYTPPQDFSGTDTILYQICDSTTLCDIDTVFIFISPVPDPPIAEDDWLSLMENSPPLIIEIAQNDTDPENNLDLSSVEILVPPSNGGNLVVEPNGTVSYQPPPGFYGTDSLIYLICDSTGLCDTAVVYIFVQNIPEPPVALVDTDTLPENSPPVVIHLSSNDTDPENNLNIGSVAIIEGPFSGGEAVENGTGGIQYTPPIGFTGNDTLVYQICDSTWLCDQDTLFIFIVPIPSPPIAHPDFLVIWMNSGGIEMDLAENDTDPDLNLDESSVLILEGPFSGATASENLQNGVFYLPLPGFNGLDTLVYSICDSTIPPLCDSDTLFILVLPMNLPPVALNDSLSGPENMPILISPISNDTDQDNDSLLLEGTWTTPQNGTIELNDDGTLIYFPDSHFVGVDSFYYIICDDDPDSILCDTALIFIDIATENHPPVAQNDTSHTFQNSPGVDILVLENDSETDGDSLVFQVLILPENGQITDNGYGMITYIPNTGFTGIDSFLYEICDTAIPPLCDTAWVFVTVPPNPLPPIANTDYDTIFEGETIVVDVQGNDTEPEGDLFYTGIDIVWTSNGSDFVYNGDSILYLSSPGFTGNDTVLYFICETLQPEMCDTAFLIITVLGMNLPPIAQNDYGQTTVETPISILILQNDADPDQDSMYAAEILVNPTHGTVSLDADGSIIYLPEAGFEGLDSFLYLVCDTAEPALCDSAYVYINVTHSLPEEFPNAFSPDGDGNNDHFILPGIGAYPKNIFTVYNRWGNVVYRKEGYFQEWNGKTTQGSSLPDGTYFYILELADTKLPRSGFVLIYRE